MKIETKFDKGDTAYAILDNYFEVNVKEVKIVGIYLEYKIIDEKGNRIFKLNYPQLFATKSEAEQALKRLEGKDE